MSNLQIDPTRLPDDILTGIYVRAVDSDGQWQSVDIAMLDKASLLTWLRSSGGENKLAENNGILFLRNGSKHEARVTARLYGNVVLGMSRQPERGDLRFMHCFDNFRFQDLFLICRQEGVLGHNIRQPAIVPSRICGRPLPVRIISTTIRFGERIFFQRILD